MYSVAVVDDDPAIRELLGDVLTEEGYIPYLFDSTNGTYQGIHAASPAAVILDLHIGQQDEGLALAERICTDPLLAHTSLILCSGDTLGLERCHPTLHGHGYTVLPKPFDIDDLAVLLERVVKTPVSASSHGV